MVNKVVPHAQLAEATAAFAKKIAAQAPLAQRLAKEALRVGLNLNLPYFFDYQPRPTPDAHLEGPSRRREVVRRKTLRKLQRRVTDRRIPRSRKG
jgi:enoyl-CoA hydratase/carnithine racemase